jgi:phosphohistidine phosphatase
MKKLLLIRHAKAEKDALGKDFDRPLKYIGIQDAAFMAERLKNNR